MNNNIIIPLLQKELEMESAITRKMLKAVPDDRWDWKPHAKSMCLNDLAIHLAELPSWVPMALNTDGIDFAQFDYTPKRITDTAHLMSIFEQALADGKASLEKAQDADLQPSWTLRTGDTIHSVMSKYETIRHAYSQTIHHRAQLGVYLRLMDIPIPGTYGPSADDKNF
jgi:uncharacterized damage-inducible protein DinB